MGFLDALKKLAAKDAPPPDSQRARNGVVDVRLPPGWQFTRAGEQYFAASGPAGATASFNFTLLKPPSLRDGDDLKAREVEASRGEIVGFVGRWVFGRPATDLTGPDGILWLEASDLDGRDRRLQFAIMNSRPRDPAIVFPPLLHVSCSGGSGAERFDAIRSALRSAGWR